MRLLIGSHTMPDLALPGGEPAAPLAINCVQLLDDGLYDQRSLLLMPEKVNPPNMSMRLLPGSQRAPDPYRPSGEPAAPLAINCVQLLDDGLYDWRSLKLPVVPTPENTSILSLVGSQTADRKS